MADALERVEARLNNYPTTFWNVLMLMEEPCTVQEYKDAWDVAALLCEEIQDARTKELCRKVLSNYECRLD